jgi:hypothetical protein
MRSLCAILLISGLSSCALAAPVCGLPRDESRSSMNVRVENEMSMREIVTQIEIDVPPDRVWAALADFAAFPSWNPFIRSLEGRLAEGERLEALIAPPGRPPMRFSPVLLAVEPDRELRWLGSLVAPWLFSGEHSFALESRSGRTTRFAHSERFSGLLAPLIMSGPRLEATRAGFVAMNEALKRRVEGQRNGRGTL